MPPWWLRRTPVDSWAHARPFTLVCRPARELRDAAVWYERERAGLGLEFVEEVGTALSSLATSVAVALAVPGTPAALQLRRQASWALACGP